MEYFTIADFVWFGLILLGIACIVVFMFNGIWGGRA